MTLPQRGFVPLSLLCAALASAIFLVGLPGDFLLDDGFNIVTNTGVHLSSLTPGAVMDAAFSPQQGGLLRTLPTLTFALDYYRGGGLDPATFKATNIAIHSVTTLVLVLFLRELLLIAGAEANRARWAALTLALAWAMHPLQVSSVLYIVQRMQTLATLFLVLALLSYLRARQAQIEGRHGRAGWILTGLLWTIALACKEDAILLPAYLLALELTVLRFRAAEPALASRLKRGFVWMSVLGAATFLLVAVPLLWSWDAYAYRDFSSYERLLTQGRVLCMYLWQIVAPLPGAMLFFYDWLQPSRGLLDPATTLPSLLLLTALLASAWWVRHTRPLYALGILLFFSGHFISSNVLGLELAFEHRNHFPLIGAVLALGDLLTLAAARLRLRPPYTALACALLLLTLASATTVRARHWHDGLELAQVNARLAPQSARAWQTLCVAYFELGGGETPENPNLDKAIAACSRGAQVMPHSIANLTNVVVLKAIQGSLAQTDWDLYLDRIEHATMTPENISRIWVILDQVRKGVDMDVTQVMDAIDLFHQRKPFNPIESAAVGYFILGRAEDPGRAYPYFEHVVRNTKDPNFASGIVDDLRKEGYAEWADRLHAMIPEAN